MTGPIKPAVHGNSIPEDWKVYELNELIQPSRSIRYGIVQPGNYDSSGDLMIRSQDYSKGWSNDERMHRVSRKLSIQYNNAKVRYGDLIITIVGAGIGQVASVPIWLDKAVLSRSTGRIAISDEKATAKFIKSFLESPLGKRQLADCQKEGAQPVVSCRDLGKFKVTCPPLTEQRSISTALKDIDDLIASLDALIAKKRDIKQAAMQQLLTGKTRLPGFEGEWESRPLGDVLWVRHGKDQKSVQRADGRFPILATGGEIGRTDTPLYSKPSVLIGRKGTIDRPQYMDQPFWTVDTLFYTEIQGENSPLFLFYVFQTIDWRSFNEASGVPSLSSKTIEGIVVNLPEPEEQAAIALTLADFDHEIEALEQRAAKSRSLKDGMMQQLLTGRIRLV